MDKEAPNVEQLYKDFGDLRIDDIYCILADYTFVMSAGAKSQNIKNVKAIVDGSAEFTKKMGMLVKKLLRFWIEVI